MSQPAADRNLLFGVLALQMDFITREQLIVAMQAWVFDKKKPLGQILLEQKALPDDNRQLLEALMQKHLAKHDNDPEKSLAAVSSATDIKNALAKIGDADVQASLVHVAANRPKDVDLYATVAPPANVTTAAGLRFRILRPHAKGGLGEVFVAQDEELHREVALKEIQERQADNQDSRTRFLMEAEITGGLEHPGIVPVYGLGTYGDGRPYYAMRFIRGDSLKDAIERFHKADAAGMEPGQRNVELRALLGRFVDVCDAIAYAHSRGVLHRDLKPGNIMLGKYGETLVVDWGLAKPLGQPAAASEHTEPGEGSLIPHSISSSSQTLMGSALGTPQYMSPEQAGGRLEQLGPASDVYSLGATLCCLLTGQPSVSDTDVGAVLNKVQRGDIRRPSEIKKNVPAPLEAICLKAMALKPDDRYPSPRGLANDIEHWLANEPVSAWPEPWTVKARRWIGRHGVLVTGTAASVVVALIGFAIAAVLLNAAKKKADENFQLARAAVNRYLTEVSSNDLLKEPGMEPLRKKLLQAAREYNQKFVAERRGDPTVQAELAMATFRLGQITAELDSELDAIKLHEEAAKIFEALPGAQVSAETKADVAGCYHHLGRLNRLVDKTARSEECYKKARDAWEQLIKDQPKEARFQDGLARSQLGLGNLCQFTRRLDAAQAMYQQAIGNWEKLHAADPKNGSYRRDLGVVHNNLGMIFKDQDGKESEAKKELLAAKGLQKPLVEEEPNIAQYQNDLAKTLYNLREFENAAQLWQAVVDRHPAVTNPHRLLAEAYAALSVVQLRGNDLKKGDDACQTAVAIKRKLAANHPGVPSYQGDLGRGLFALGGIALKRKAWDEAEIALSEAVHIQDALTRDLPDVPHYQRDLARTSGDLGYCFAAGKKYAKAAEAYKKSFNVWEKLIKEHGSERDYRASEYQTCMELGHLAHSVRDHQEAAVWYTRALDLAPESNKSAIKKRLTDLQSK